MDVENIQKINALAQDLVKQGLAKDRDDALAQAEKVFRAKEDSYTSVKEGASNVGSVQARVAQQQQASKKSADDVTLEQIKDALKQNTSYIIKKFKEYEEKITLLQREVKALNTQMRTSRVTSGPTVKELVAKEVPQVQAPAAQPKKQEASSAHPRVGKFAENDVSIEKFFYMGSR